MASKIGRREKKKDGDEGQGDNANQGAAGAGFSTRGGHLGDDNDSNMAGDTDRGTIPQ